MVVSVLGDAMRDCVGDCSAAVSKVIVDRSPHNPENGGQIAMKCPHYRGQTPSVPPPCRGQNGHLTSVVIWKIGR
jgi:hypothetical protein